MRERTIEYICIYIYGYRLEKFYNYEVAIVGRKKTDPTKKIYEQKYSEMDRKVWTMKMHDRVRMTCRKRTISM